MSERYPSQRPPLPPLPPPPPPDDGIFDGNPACGCACGGENCCAPRFCRPDRENVPLQRCCDRNGCCCFYPASCRNDFWPEFTHPGWLCCVDLYSENKGCYDCCAEPEKTCGCEAK